jgi:hypothetical protein
MAGYLAKRYMRSPASWRGFARLGSGILSVSMVFAFILFLTQVDRKETVSGPKGDWQVWSSVTLLRHDKMGWVFTYRIRQTAYQVTESSFYLYVLLMLSSSFLLYLYAILIYFS